MSTEDKPTGAASDEMKRKFKEALDKKNAKHRDGEAHLDGDSVVHGIARSRLADQARVPPQERLRGAAWSSIPRSGEIGARADLDSDTRSAGHRRRRPTACPGRDESTAAALSPSAVRGGPGDADSRPWLGLPSLRLATAASSRPCVPTASCDSDIPSWSSPEQRRLVERDVAAEHGRARAAVDLLDPRADEHRRHRVAGEVRDRTALGHEAVDADDDADAVDEVGAVGLQTAGEGREPGAGDAGRTLGGDDHEDAAARSAPGSTSARPCPSR